MQKVCRTCLQEVPKANCFALGGDTESLQVKKQLEFCIPEMVVDLVKDPILCLPCVTALNSAHDFKNLCLRTEERVRSWMRENHFDISKILKSTVQCAAVDAVLDGVTNQNDGNQESLLDCSFYDDRLQLEQMKSKHGDAEEIKKEYETTEPPLPKLENPAPGESCETHSSRDDGDVVNYFADNLENRSSTGTLEILEENRMLIPQCSMLLTKIPNNNVTKNEAELYGQTDKEESAGSIKHCDLPDPQRFHNSYLQTDKKLKHFNWKAQINRKEKPLQSSISECKTDKKKPYKCYVCNYRGEKKHYLKRHAVIHSQEKPLKCDRCNFGTAYKGSLLAHLKIHNNEKPFKCNICKYNCRHRSDLKKHVRIHSGEKPYKCSVCDYKCSTKPCLNMHMGTHMEELPFSCNKCEYRTIHKGNLRRHMNTHAEAKPFKCRICKYSAKQKSDVSKHMLCHWAITTLKCECCGFRSRTKQNLAKHLQIHGIQIF